MSTAGYQFRKRKQGLFYGIPPAPWKEPKPRTHPTTSKTKASLSTKSRKARTALATPDDHQQASSTTTNLMIDDTPSTIFHVRSSQPSQAFYVAAFYALDSFLMRFRRGIIQRLFIIVLTMSYRSQMMRLKPCHPGLPSHLSEPDLQLCRMMMME
jgi:hypothetical protein